MKWVINKNSETKVIDNLARELNISTVISSMLVKRGVTTFEQAKDFFRPNFEKLHDPFLMKDMIEAKKETDGQTDQLTNQKGFYGS